MDQTSKIQLKESSILNIPLHTYEKDFTFIVNGEEFKTSRLISDLLSPKISKMHATDVTLDTFTINTKINGHFANVLKLVDFDQQDITINEIPFILEVLEILDAKCIEINLPDNFTKENVFEQLFIHEKNKDVYHLLYQKEIEFISSHFFEICEECKSKLMKLELPTLYDILSDSHFVINDEDQLLQFVNELYSQNSSFSILYETVQFTNVSINQINKFIELYDFNQLTNSTWFQICERLKIEIQNDKKLLKDERYNTKRTSQNNNNNNNNNKSVQQKLANGNQFSFTGEKKGIINFLREKSNGKIEDEIIVSSSSVSSDVGYAVPFNVVLNDNHKYFASADMPNSLITLNFKNHRVIPTGYTINVSSIYLNRIPRSWVIEGSNDYGNWEIIDQRSDFSDFDSFLAINNSNNDFKYIRMRLTGSNWAGTNHLYLRKIEFYGTLI